MAPDTRPTRILITRHACTRLVGMWQDATPMGAGRMQFVNYITGRPELLELGQYT